jgi:polyisoprenyl-phosphate glycosyltransferase
METSSLDFIQSLRDIGQPLPTVSVVAPAYNEQESLMIFYERVSAVMKSLTCVYEIVLVNDGSTDKTLELMESLGNSDPHIAYVNLSRNFGKEIALTAGLDKALGDVIIILDADLQDPPELIPEMLRAWTSGFDVVYGVRINREGETWFKQITSRYFYYVIESVSRVKIPRDTGDFRLMSRRAVNELVRLREHHRFMKGMFAWIGFPSTPIFYNRDARVAGVTKWNYWKLWNLAIEGITSFSIAPLKISMYSGILIALASMSYAIYIIWKTVAYGDPVRGYPSLMVIVLFMGGVQLISIGVLGEYLGRIFNEVKGRPLYLVERFKASLLTRSVSGF